MTPARCSASKRASSENPLRSCHAPRLNETEVDKLRVLYEDSPLPVTTLALQTGHAPAAIYACARRRGWKSRAARRSARLPRAEIRALYEDTIVPVSEIARLAGVAVPTIRVWAARDGWKPPRGKGSQVYSRVNILSRTRLRI